MSVAILAALILATAPDQDIIPLDQYPVADQPLDDPVAVCLLDEGFSGRPDDGAEAIYAPREAIEWCADTYRLTYV